jgi:CheY-like chemotaxis protein
VLLVDDNPTDLFINSLVLENEQLAAHIDSAADGQEALDYIEHTAQASQCPDLILLDINMRMNGFEFLDQYANTTCHAASATTIVMLPTSSHPQDKQRASTYRQVKAYLDKPLTAEKLLKVIRPASG